MKLTRLCLFINHDDQNQMTLGHSCGSSYDEKIVDSSEPVQEIDFSGYDFELELRSSRDPHIRFGLMTGGSYTLDERES